MLIFMSQGIVESVTLVSVMANLQCFFALINDKHDIQRKICVHKR